MNSHNNSANSHNSRYYSSLVHTHNSLPTHPSPLSHTHTFFLTHAHRSTHPCKDTQGKSARIFLSRTHTPTPPPPLFRKNTNTNSFLHTRIDHHTPARILQENSRVPPKQATSRGTFHNSSTNPHTSPQKRPHTAPQKLKSEPPKMPPNSQRFSDAGVGGGLRMLGRGVERMRMGWG